LVISIPHISIRIGKTSIPISVGAYIKINSRKETGKTKEKGAMNTCCCYKYCTGSNQRSTPNKQQPHFHLKTYITDEYVM
jgi:hypothetical protein